MPGEKTVLQKIAHATGSVVTPSNLMDVAALYGVYKNAPKLDTTSGIVKVGASFTADMGDGPVARMTGTTGEFGKFLDHTGDKPKVLWSMWNMSRLGLVPKDIIALTVGQQVATMAAVVYDQALNETPKIGVSVEGEHHMAGLTFGNSLHAIGADFGRHGHPKAERRLKTFGSVLVRGSTALLGVPSTQQYWSQALGHGPESTEVSGRASPQKMAMDFLKVLAVGSALTYGGRVLSAFSPLPTGMNPEFQEHDPEPLHGLEFDPPVDFS
jgi:phosphatidylglycerophosphate synthase